MVQAGLRGHRASVYLFGSWARGSAARASDIEVAVLPVDPCRKGC